jgi:hypothetical protein
MPPKKYTTQSCTCEAADLTLHVCKWSPNESLCQLLQEHYWGGPISAGIGYCFGEDNVDLRIDLWGQRLTTVGVGLHKLNSWSSNWSSKKNGQFPDDPAKNKSLTKSHYRLTDVLTIADMKEIVFKTPMCSLERINWEVKGVGRRRI